MRNPFIDIASALRNNTADLLLKKVIIYPDPNIFHTTTLTSEDTPKSTKIHSLTARFAAHHARPSC